jgi:hypothetical protein
MLKPGARIHPATRGPALQPTKIQQPLEENTVGQHTGASCHVCPGSRNPSLPFLNPGILPTRSAQHRSAPQAKAAHSMQSGQKQLQTHACGAERQDTATRQHSHSSPSVPFDCQQAQPVMQNETHKASVPLAVAHPQRRNHTHGCCCAWPQLPYSAHTGLCDVQLPWLCQKSLSGAMPRHLCTQSQQNMVLLVVSWSMPARSQAGAVGWQGCVPSPMHACCIMRMCVAAGLAGGRKPQHELAPSRPHTPAPATAAVAVQLCALHWQGCKPLSLGRLGGSATPACSTNPASCTPARARKPDNTTSTNACTSRFSIGTSTHTPHCCGLVDH